MILWMPWVCGEEEREILGGEEDGVMLWLKMVMRKQRNRGRRGERAKNGGVVHGPHSWKIFFLADDLKGKG